MKIRLVRSILLGLVILCSATNLAAKSDPADGGYYTAKDKEYYLSPEQLAFIRPGLEITILDVTLPADGQLEVTYSITDPSGLPLDHDGIATPGPVDMRFTLANIPAGQDKKTRLAYERIDRGNGTLTSMGDGVYKYKFETAVSTDPDTTHTLVLGGRRDLREFDLDRYPANAVKNWVPSGASAPAPRDVVRVETCNRCHNPLVMHGRWLSVTACEQCHNPTISNGPVYSFDVMIHKVHSGQVFDGHDFSDVVFPAEINECQVCHTGGVPTADLPLVASPNPIPVCDASGLGMTDLTWGDLSPFEIHMNAPDGKLFAVSKGAGTKATGKWVKDGTRFFVVDKATGVLVQNLEVDTTALGCVGEQPGTFRGVAGTQNTKWETHPTRAACGSCHTNVDFVTGEHHPGGPQADDTLCGFCHQPAPNGDMEFDASVSGAHKPEYKSRQLPGVIVEIMGVSNTNPGQRPTVTFSLKSKNAMLNPASLNRLNLTITGPNTDFSFYAQETVGSKAVKVGDNWAYTFAAPLPMNATGSYTVGFEGRNIIDIQGRDGIEEVEDFAQDATFAFAVTDPAAVPRRMVVDDALCENCHSNLSLHGGNRNNPQYCVTCHRPDASDAAVAPAGATPQSIHFKFMIHKIHRGENLEKGYAVYGYRGSFNPFGDVAFPGDLRDCNTCHVDDSYQLPLPAGVLPTMSPQTLIDPLQPTAAACLSCHDSDDAAAHAESNTVFFGEACAACHGPDAEFAVDKVHAR